jgi:hypothetical protein
MNYPRLAMAAVVGLVVYFGWGYLIEGRLIRDHFIPSQSVYRDISAMQKYMPLGLLSSLLAIFVMAMIYARVSAAPGAVLGVSSGAFGLLFGIFAARIHPISNFVTRISTRASASKPPPVASFSGPSSALPSPCCTNPSSADGRDGRLALTLSAARPRQ